MISKNRLAGIQYVGLPGISKTCAQAIQRMLQYGDHIARATLLTSGHDHCLLLIVDEDDKVAVKSGFASGYGGEGPSALSMVLKLLLDHGANVEEVEVDRAILERIDSSALTVRDVDAICSSKVVRPTRIYDYIYDARLSSDSLGMHWNRFPAVLPFAIIDRRIADLALRFHEEPNDTLLQGFRRLEDTIRQRTASKEHGAKLFSQAFQGEGAKLTWEDVQPSELVGRVNLFTGAYMAHRNPRAHQELKDSTHELLSEFLLLNHLFKLESKAVPSAILDQRGYSEP
ncbi:MAG: TIGR02391 family protein [Thiobacillus sp.]